MTRLTVLTALCLTLAASAAAQEGAADVEAGDTQYSAQTSLRPPRARSGGGGVRLALQGRLPLAALAWSDGDLDGNNFGGGGGGGGGLGGGAGFDALNLAIPMVTPGIRLVDGKLFLGLGLGFSSWSSDQGPNEISRTGWSLSPLAAYDVLSDEFAALSLGGALNMMKLGDTQCNGNCNDANDDTFGLGINLTAGIRAKLSEGLSIGTEFGWGFLTIDENNGGNWFLHGLMGALVVEGSIGI